MQVSKLTTFLIALGILVLAYAQRDFISQQFFKLIHSGPGQSVVDLVNNSSFLPAPLHFGDSSVSGTLTSAGVIKETNAQRAKYGNAPLHENAKLTAAAQAKLKDMFDQQYFEHESPQGVGPSDLAEKAGYKYLVVGENLAEGHFKDDTDLVQAWMNSPGHRANILHDGFQEIGVAVGQGQFEGKTVWMAVQEFGTPASVCPSPSQSDAEQINANKARIEVLKQQAQSQRNDRDAYNATVRELNQLINATTALVNQYNAAVDSFNRCLEQNS